MSKDNCGYCNKQMSDAVENDDGVFCCAECAEYFAKELKILSDVMRQASLLARLSHLSATIGN